MCAKSRRSCPPCIATLHGLLHEGAHKEQFQGQFMRKVSPWPMITNLYAGSWLQLLQMKRCSVQIHFEHVLLPRWAVTEQIGWMMNLLCRPFPLYNTHENHFINIWSGYPSYLIVQDSSKQVPIYLKKQLMVFRGKQEAHFVTKCSIELQVEIRSMKVLRSPRGNQGE